MNKLRVLALCLLVCSVTLAANQFFSDLSNTPTVLSKAIDGSSELETRASDYVNELKEFYKFNLANADKELTEAELRKFGGVCKHFADWYVKRAEADGVDARTVDFKQGKYKHRITIISEGSDYCVLDQTDYWCKKLEGVDYET